MRVLTRRGPPVSDGLLVTTVNRHRGRVASLPPRQSVGVKRAERPCCRCFTGGVVRRIDATVTKRIQLSVRPAILGRVIRAARGP
jgi:hypothetical protein